MWPKSDWPLWHRITQWVLAAALALASLYVAGVFIERWRQPAKSAAKPGLLPLSPDYWVMPPKSYVRSLKDARAFLGKPLWVREGYRWTCSPGPETLDPMERLVPQRVFARSREVWLEFTRGGRRCAIPVSAGDTFFLDEIFLIRDPREVYKDWPAEAWNRIAERRIEPGMTETQITFSLGYGVLVRGLSGYGDAHRVVDHIGGERRMRVTYEYGIAKAVQPLP